MAGRASRAALVRAGGGEALPAGRHVETEEGACQVRQKLLDAFPARARQVDGLLELFGGSFDVIPPVLIYGGSGTGKSTLVKETLRLLRRPHAFVSCCSCFTPGLIFESVVNQLMGHVRTAANNYCSIKRLKKLSELVEALPEAVATATSRHDFSSAETGVNQHIGQQSAASEGKPLTAAMGVSELSTAAQNKEKPVYLVFDNIELLKTWEDGFQLLAALVRLPELSGQPNVGAVFISTLGWDCFRCETGSREPIPLHFPDYSDADLTAVLSRKHQLSAPYVPFLSTILKTVSRATRSLMEVESAVELLYDKYCEPFTKGKDVVPENEDGRRRLFRLLRPHLQAVMKDPLQMHFCRSEVSSGKSGGLLLPITSTFLLLAGYIASRNPATLDADVFDFKDTRESKRKRRRSAAVEEKIEREVQEGQLRGPGHFPLERVLAIYSCIVENEGDDLTGESMGRRVLPLPTTGDPSAVSLHQTFGDGEVRVGESWRQVSAELLMQVATLVRAGLLVKSNSDPLDAGTKFWCMVDQDLIRKIAADIKFPLDPYLRFG